MTEDAHDDSETEWEYGLDDCVVVAGDGVAVEAVVVEDVVFDDDSSAGVEDGVAAEGAD